MMDCCKSSGGGVEEGHGSHVEEEIWSSPVDQVLMFGETKYRGERGHMVVVENIDVARTKREDLKLTLVKSEGWDIGMLVQSSEMTTGSLSP